MAIEAVRAYLSALGREGEILEFPVSSATVELAAKAVGTIPARIAKTLSFVWGESALLIVAAGDAKVDNRRFKDTFGCKAKMLAPDAVEELTGHAVGGVCPFALAREDILVCLDESLRRFETVFPACGSSNSAIELGCDDLFSLAKAEKWVDVCKGWRPEEG
ncbi:YbaK/EbsC family protein [bacterium 210820-DFI.6.52]|uniref:Cys-tRNA(Pro) deacylase, prolyl-tRNA editing enzyme YbaK/EbsC n=1 Tax=Bittarella massiliensis (ex Durand et al. 2017) TaxID=1720313 RepID=A0AAQ1RVD6_9FIRM|nr:MULTISPECIES: YbaK/EbsC family protein [Eubacteriales]MCB5940745.1 YbaK/EbsC family protein [bacterium 210820-DFI.6.52]ERI98914.1 YbaK/proline--tRNA ligase associated domain protein [Clostridium sp. ATCC 29733]MZL70063.1 YbaK/EbsC family protein [Bittarella massiliensis (ex Durand et al. 2017)]MZL81233.1 YbaK/EbsC family protein [Bittarella massiliensis (ex Durand et al. 2017)]SHF81352.1 Cys-tRNA(Pro) deacylase, prolyl-tRNA editing enzyme YbaK/EbsC [Bittarella massiliensis (ex Durand et al.